MLKWNSLRTKRSPQVSRTACFPVIILPMLVMSGLVGCGSSKPEPVAEFQSLDSQTLGSQTETDHLTNETVTPRKSAHRGDIELTAASSALQKADGTDDMEKGSPQWLLREIVRLRSAPLETVRTPVPGAAGEFTEVQLPPEQVKQEQSRRNQKTIHLASQVISKTHQDATQEQWFNSAVHYLADARMQLALAGQEDQAQLLMENAESLFKRDATSFAAVEAASRMLQLTQEKARQTDSPDPKWALAFARQARLFAANFPQETHRSAVNVLEASRVCEQLGYLTEAETCLAWIEQGYPQTPYAEQAAGPLRRLRLVGEPLNEFGGPLLNGGYLSMKQFRGKAVLIAFWTADSARFRNDLPVIQATLDRFLDRVVAVGVNLDTDVAAVEQFVSHSRLAWPQVFYSDPEKRGKYNLVARHYGVEDVPQYWLVDSRGIVRSVNLSIADLDKAVATSFVK